MNAVALERYLRFLPLGTSLAGEVPASLQKSGLVRVGNDVALPPVAAEQMYRYSFLYSRLNHGWLLTRAFINRGIPLPTALDEENDTMAMDRLYNVFVYGSFDAAILKAISFQQGDMATRKALLEGAILAMRNEKDYRRVASELGLEEDVVRCYEQLFFNVYDRAAETLYLASNIYDASRLVEFDEDYMSTAAREDLIRRIGMVGSIDDIRHIMGSSRNDRLDTLSNPDIPAKLESTLMANGYMMARLGWINQGRHSVGLRHAKGLISAAKMSGNAQDNPGSVFSSLGLGRIITQDLGAILAANARARKEAAIDSERRAVMVEAVGSN